MCYKCHSITSKVESAIFTIEIGQVQLYKCIVKSSIHEEEEKVLRTYISKIMLLYQILLEKKLDRCDETVRLLEKLPRLFGNLEVIEEAENSPPVMK